MSAGRIVVGPMDDAATIIPFVFALERDVVADGQAIHSGRKIDVVGNQQCLPGDQCHDESLMAAAVVVVREYPRDGSAPLSDKVSATVGKRRRKNIVSRAVFPNGPEVRKANESGDRQASNKNEDFFHF